MWHILCVYVYLSTVCFSLLEYKSHETIGFVLFTAVSVLYPHSVEQWLAQVDTQSILLLYVVAGD